MSVTVRPYRNTGGWEVDILFRLPNGRRHRERSKAPVSSKSGAQRWGEDRERHLLQHGLPQVKKEVPTLKDFASRFIDGHARANQQKPSAIAAKESILRVHLIPQLGSKKLDAVTTEDVQRLKQYLSGRAPKTVNNALTVLNTLLRKAVEWGVIEVMPCRIRLLSNPRTSTRFHDFMEFEGLVRSATALGWRAKLAVLLGGEAGLRLGEITALEWKDVDLAQRQLCVQRSEWHGHVTAPKGGRLRHVPLTAQLGEALRSHRHLRHARVLCDDAGEPLTAKMVSDLVRRAARSAELTNRGVHVLRHTFCSHLAMRGAPTRSIQELAGHREAGTTQRYMHLSPAAIEGAIRLLDAPRVPVSRGDMLETVEASSGKA